MATPTERLIRYVPTYVNRDGMRTLMRACQGRDTFATAAESDAWIRAVCEHTAPSTLTQVWGPHGAPFETRAVECWPSGDPVRVWFENARPCPADCRHALVRHVGTTDGTSRLFCLDCNTHCEGETADG